MATNRSFANMLNQVTHQSAPVAVRLQRPQHVGRMVLPHADFNQSIKQSIWKRLASLGGK